MKNDNYKKENSLDFWEGIENMATSIGKWLAYTIMAFAIVFLIIAFFRESLLDKFLDWSLKIIYAVVGGTVIYIIVKVVNKK